MPVDTSLLTTIVSLARERQGGPDTADRGPSPCAGADPAVCRRRPAVRMLSPSTASASEPRRTSQAGRRRTWWNLLG